MSANEGILRQQKFVIESLKTLSANVKNLWEKWLKQ